MVKSNMKTAIVINGPARSGKDSFVTFCRELLGEDVVTSISAIDPIKQAMIADGSWDGIDEHKTEAIRKAMFDRKMEFVRDDPQAINKLLVKKIQESTFDLTFIHCREPEQIELLRELCNDNNLGNYAIHVSRTNVGIPENYADESTLKYHDYNFYIKNDGDLEDLRKTATAFLVLLGKDLGENFELKGDGIPSMLLEDNPNISIHPFYELTKPPEHP
jgi:hypothetical protein